MTTLKNLASPSTLRSTWSVLRSVPGGGRLMGGVLGRLAPYTGTIRAEVVSLDRGYAKLRMADTRRVRNHLNSVHAIALINLAEATTGVAMMYSLPDDARGIPNQLSIEYLKKARGPITAECTCETPDAVTERLERVVTAELKNEAGELVARMSAHWVIGPKS
jgi:acyl-coenzyme A thioesterase PaaI-like protein